MLHNLQESKAPLSVLHTEQKQKPELCQQLLQKQSEQQIFVSIAAQRSSDKSEHVLLRFAQTVSVTTIAASNKRMYKFPVLSPVFGAAAFVVCVVDVLLAVDISVVAVVCCGIPSSAKIT